MPCVSVPLRGVGLESLHMGELPQWVPTSFRPLAGSWFGKNQEFLAWLHTNLPVSVPLRGVGLESFSLCISRSHRRVKVSVPLRGVGLERRGEEGKRGEPKEGFRPLAGSWFGKKSYVRPQRGRERSHCFRPLAGSWFGKGLSDSPYGAMDSGFKSTH